MPLGLLPLVYVYVRWGCRSPGRQGRHSMATVLCVCVSRSVVSISLRPHGLYPPGSSVQGTLQARILQWIMPSSMGIFPTQGSNPHHFTSPALAGRFFISEPPVKPLNLSLFLFCMCIILYCFKIAHKRYHTVSYKSLLHSWLC